MVLEATVLVIDNSEWMRNGDYTPTRFEAQHDAVPMLFNAKTQSNPENTVGLMTMGGKSPNVLVTLTTDIGKILTALHRVQVSGKPNFVTSIQIAQLMLKHRQEKNQHQRIIVFIGSPITEDEETLVKIAKKLKKNNVAVDVVSFGENTENTAKLEAFMAAVVSSNNSNLLTVPPGPHILSDMIISSPIISGEDGPPPGFAGGAGFEFGVDPNLDPELALALRISMEEERTRQEMTDPSAAAAANSETPSQVTTASTPSATSGIATSHGTIEDEMLAQALALSLEGGVSGSSAAHAGGAGEDVEMVDDNDAAMARAIALSMAGNQAAGAPGAAAGGAIDPNFMSSVLQSLPGVDPNDPRLKSALQGNKPNGAAKGGSPSKDGKSKKDEKK